MVVHVDKDFNFGYGALGGFVIGVASILHFYVNRKVSGISGISSSFSNLANGFYFAGLITAGAILKEFDYDVFGATNNLRNNSESLITYYLLGGLLVGFGTRLGNGCTSGHGLCGLGRFSPRSLVAVMIFMFFGALTSWGANETDGFVFKTLYNNNLLLKEMKINPAIVIASVLFLNLLPYFFYKDYNFFYTFSIENIKKKLFLIDNLINYFINYFIGILFGIGLGVSGMCDTDRVTMFLNFTGKKGWDPSLIAVLGVGCIVTVIGFYYFNQKKKQEKENCECEYKLNYALCPENLVIDANLVIGSAVFGIGWGLCGICPGPGIVSTGASINSTKLFVTGMFAGMSAFEIYKFLLSKFF